MYRKTITETCAQCGVSFVVRADLGARFCSRRCYWNSRKVERIPVVCRHCGKAFETAPWWRKRGFGVFCSRVCKRGGTDLERFWANVQKESECWRWVGGTNKTGYGRMHWRGPNTLAHRISWVIHFGAIPEGLEILHKCSGGGNPWCVNPFHLVLGTHSENMADMVSAGRSRRCGIRKRLI